MATIPIVPVDSAGVIAASADLNALSNAAAFVSKSATGNAPMFFLMANTTQTWGTSNMAVNYSNAAAIFKDNDGGFSSSTNWLYTIQTPGYWQFDYCVNGGTTPGGSLQSVIWVNTTAANPIYPSESTLFANSRSFPYSGAGVPNYNCSGSVCPLSLAPGDTVQVIVTTATTSTSGTNPYSFFTGEWVSA